MWVFFLACTQQAKDSGGDDSNTLPVSNTYTADIRLMDAADGSPLFEAILLGDQNTEDVLTNESGEGQTSVSENYTIKMSLDGYTDHYYQGRTSEDFEIIALLASDAFATQIYSMLGLGLDASKGTLIVALDEADLSPAIGASATIDGNMSQAFVIGATGPSFGTVITGNGSSIVSFPNLDSGDYTINTINSNGVACTVFPNGGDAAQQISVRSSAVTVAVYTCP